MTGVGAAGGGGDIDGAETGLGGSSAADGNLGMLLAPPGGFFFFFLLVLMVGILSGVSAGRSLGS